MSRSSHSQTTATSQPCGKGRLVFLIAFNIADPFRQPIGGIRSRHHRAPGAWCGMLMPETAMHEDRLAPAGEHNVRETDPIDRINSLRRWASIGAKELSPSLWIIRLRIGRDPNLCFPPDFRRKAAEAPPIGKRSHENDRFLAGSRRVVQQFAPLIGDRAET